MKITRPVMRYEVLWSNRPFFPIYALLGDE